MADQTWCEITLKQNPDSSKENYEKDVERLNNKLEEVYNITVSDFWEILNEPQWVKYYSFEPETKKESKKYPHILFQVDTEGEIERESMRVYFLNGKSYEVEPEIRYPEFNKKHLR